MAKSWGIQQHLFPFSDITLEQGAPIKQGAHGAIYAVQDHPHKSIAIKVSDVMRNGQLHRNRLISAMREGFVSLLIMENKLELPGVVTIHQVFAECDAASSLSIHTVMPLVEKSLAESISSMPYDETRIAVFNTVYSDIRAGLKGLHSMGIVHGDVKTDNILQLGKV